MEFSWLPDGSEESVRAALADVAPELAGASFVARGRVDESNPMWCSSSALVAGAIIVKFAWTKPAAARLHREVLVFEALGDDTAALLLPPVAFSSMAPALLGTRKLPGAPLTHDVAKQLDAKSTTRAAHQLGGFLAALHAPKVLDKVRARGVPLGEAVPQGDTAALRERFPRIVTGHRQSLVLRWCDWVEETLAPGAEEVLVHGDLHVHNQLWDHATLTLRAVVDFETAAAADRAYDFRYLPREFDLFLATARSYEQLAGTRVDVARVMAWHILTSLGDALWRAEANVPMPAGGTTPDEWFDLVADRLERLNLDPT